MNKIEAIFLVRGHSKYNPGANCKFLNEEELVKKITTQVSDRISRTDNVAIYTVDVNEEFTIAEKAKYINYICKANGYNVYNSICIEIHTNAAGGTGPEVLGYTGYPDFDKLGAILTSEVSKVTGLRDRGIKQGKGYEFIESTTPLAMIFECGFIDNDIDRVVFNYNLEYFSEGIYNGLCKILGINPEKIVEEAIEEEEDISFPISDNRCKKLTTINQSNIKENTKSCTHISSYNNYVYNGGTIEITEKLINANILEAEELGLLGDNSGGNGAKNSKFLAEKLSSNYIELYKLRHIPESLFLLEKGYAIQVSIDADIDYLKDLIDDLIINSPDYSKLKDGDRIFKHRTNLIKEDDKYFIIDNFYGKRWNKYEIEDVDSFLTKIISHEMFVFI